MRARNVVREVCTRLAGLAALRRRSTAFVCGDCERWQRCGSSLAVKNECAL